MSVVQLLPLSVVHSRRSAALLAPSSFPVTRSLTWQAETAARAKACGVGLTSPVTVAIDGTLNGVAQSESFLVQPTTPSVAFSSKYWSTITQISVSGSGPGAVAVDAIGGSGQLMVQETVLNATLRGRLVRRRSGSMALLPQGQVVEDRWAFFTVGETLRLGDILGINGERWEVQTCYPVYGQRGQSHVEAEIHRIT